MSAANRLRNSVERWLIHENYKFANKKNEDATFCIVIKNLSAFGIPVEIFLVYLQKIKHRLHG